MSNPDLEPQRGKYLVVGLGNPGTRYQFTRHNIGFMVLDRLAFEQNYAFEVYGELGLVSLNVIEGFEYCLLKPLTYMNRSGRAVGEIIDRYNIPIANVLAVSDDYHLPLGRIRIRRKGSDGGHKGLKSLIRTLGTSEFPRLRLGIGPVSSDVDPKEYVLHEFGKEELDLLQNTLKSASAAVWLWLEKRDLDLCMNRFNS